MTLVFNGEVVEKIPLSADRKSADFKKTLRVTRSGWYHLRAEGAPADRVPARHRVRAGLHQPRVGHASAIGRSEAVRRPSTA